jgi:DNA-directed RNA polymerase subunit RPC12/RpoP
MENTSPCPNCGSRALYKSFAVSAAVRGYSPDLLPGLGSFFVPGKYNLVMCRDCGLTRFFAQAEAREKLSDSKKWKPL